MFSLIFVAGTEKARRENLHDLNILCYLVRIQAVIHLSESEEAETVRVWIGQQEQQFQNKRKLQKIILRTHLLLLSLKKTF